MTSSGLCNLLRPLCAPVAMQDESQEMCQIVRDVCEKPTEDLKRQCKQLDNEPYLDADLQARCDAFGLSDDWGVPTPPE